jgi:hypothetical protein
MSYYSSFHSSLSLFVEIAKCSSRPVRTTTTTTGENYQSALATSSRTTGELRPHLKSSSFNPSSSLLSGAVPLLLLLPFQLLNAFLSTVGN